MPILQAIVDGKTIQHQTINREWYDSNVASLDHLVTITESSPSQSTDLSRMQKSAGRRCKSTSRSGG